MYTLGSNTLIKIGRFPSLHSVMPFGFSLASFVAPSHPTLGHHCFPCSICPMSRIMQCVACFLSVSMMLSRFITVVVLYCCKVFTVWICHSLIIHSSADGSLGCFQFGAIVSEEYVHRPLFDTSFHFSWVITLWIIGSHGRYDCNLIRNCQPGL